ncbi:hypothetical protein HY36_12240 [Hyphomonas atlantica]|uniref:Uncharacterized protein n=1 Tax=Hyphomonas atlantica TaxID=1280948 RepID=A0A059EAQ1_9PROT|nr:hypothetical protein HY36_12240 [Hyphomonas atlantica]
MGYSLHSMQDSYPANLVDARARANGASARIAFQLVP